MGVLEVHYRCAVDTQESSFLIEPFLGALGVYRECAKDSKGLLLIHFSFSTCLIFGIKGKRGDR